MNRLGYILHVLVRNNRFAYRVIKGKNPSRHVKIIGIIRCRNEELVLQDSLDYLSRMVDGVVLYDDASTDKTVEIARNHPMVLEVIRNKKWRQHQRAWEETANRKLLYDRARRGYNPDWFVYVDADERIEGDVREFLNSKESDGIDGIRVQLFDAYVTPSDKEDYTQGMQLLNFRKYFGNERRDILMIWRNLPNINYSLPKPDMREPHGLEDGKNVITKFYCQHYGKAISVQQWEDTCEYYATNFPMYAAKWEERRGKAVHDKSDFGTELMTWRQLKKHGGVKIG